MNGVFIGFGIIATVIAVGYVAGRLRIGGPDAGYVLNRIAFFVASPALLFTVLARADLRQVFSPVLLVSLIVAAAMFLIYALLARLLWRKDASEVTIGALAAGYVNANNIGLPVAVYVLGDAQYVAPVLLIQLCIFAPVALGILDVAHRGSASIGTLLGQPFRNPMIIASLAGVALAAAGLHLPDAVMAPFELLGGAAVPIVLLAFGMSLRGGKPFAAGGDRAAIVLATLLKFAVMPLAAFVLARFAFGLEGAALYVAVVLAALPTAQNVYNFAARYGRAEALARDTALITTVLSLPVLIVIAAVLAPGG